MEIKDNPLLQPEDFMAGYRDSIDGLKNNPALVSFDKVCYELFEATEMGRKFMEIVHDRYLVPSIVNRDAPNYQLMVIWADGFKDAFRLIKQSVMSHQQRIKAESNT